MNWKNYKNLTSKQKEEYNFCFNQKEQFNVYSLSIIVMNLFLVVIILFFMAYLIMNTPIMEDMKIDVTMYVSTAAQMMFIVYIFVIGYMVEFLYRLIKRTILYNKWKKENKIKIKYDWWKG